MANGRIVRDRLANGRSRLCLGDFESLLGFLIERDIHTNASAELSW